MIISIIVVILCFLFSFCCIRCLMSNIIDYLMNTSAKRKRKKGMGFKDWFTYKRFRIEIPYYHIVFYYAVMFFFIVLLILVIVLHIYKPNLNFKILRLSIIYGTIFFCFIYQAAFQGIHWTWTRINKKEQMYIRGISKKAYRKKLRQQSETQSDDSFVLDDA